MNSIYIPSNNPADWKSLLADPEKHWKTGYSAKALANSWEAAKGFPKPVEKVLKDSGIQLFQDIEMLLAIPEYKVPLKPYRSKSSQNDIFVLAKGNYGLVSIMVEGKVDEPFGETVREWMRSDRGGKKERLAFLCEELGVDLINVEPIKYQLLHRAASAVIEAKRFSANNALMLIHIFKNDYGKYKESLQDYLRFVSLYRKEGNENHITFLVNTGGIDFYAGWVEGEKRFLKR